MQPLCFVLMPFGRKTDDGGRLIDFDAVYSNLLAPAARAAGLEVIRGDGEQTGGTIHKPMFERLLHCEYAIADLTTANANVYYELGIRHAVRPRSTLLLFASGTRLPFDVALLRGMSYSIDRRGRLIKPKTGAAAIAARLRALHGDHTDDSPLFQLIDDMPRITLAHEKTDSFRQRADHAQAVKDRLASASRSGVAAVRAVLCDPEYADLSRVEAGIAVDLYLTCRDVKLYDAMLDLYNRMPKPLQRNCMVREQRGLALNRLGRDAEAEAVLKAVITEFGASSETNGLLGRVYKDRWTAASKQGDEARARGELKRAIDTYLKGFEADWRDAYPGINALTLMELGDRPDPRAAAIAPVVFYAAMRRAQGASADYWDQATLLEVAVLARDRVAATAALEDALPAIRQGWWAESTADNLALLRDRRAKAGEDVGWIEDFMVALRGVAERLSP